MRAIRGAVVSSKRCSLSKAFRVLELFYDSAASDLPSADCAAYLRAAADATNDHELFRRGLRANQQQGAANLEGHDYEGERKYQDRERKGDIAVPTGGPHRNSAAEVELDVAAGEKRSKKKKKEDRQQGKAVPGAESHILTSTEISREKREREKDSIKEIAVYVKQEPDLVADEELLSEKKSKKKKEKGRQKLEVEARAVNEVGGNIVNNGGLEKNDAGLEKKMKRKKHEEEQVNSKDVKHEEKMVSDGVLDTEKRRKKKRGRGESGDNDDNALEQVEHTKKKQRK